MALGGYRPSLPELDISADGPGVGAGGDSACPKFRRWRERVCLCSGCVWGVEGSSCQVRLHVGRWKAPKTRLMGWVPVLIFHTSLSDLSQMPSIL